jgi:FlgD Ig-like domain
VRPERSAIALVIGFLLLLPSWSAGKPPKLNVTSDPPPPTGGATLSGTLIKKSAATTSWYLYPGACVQRALGNWSPKASAVADSLQPHVSFPNSSGYTDNQPVPGSNTIAYTREDLSSSEKSWRVVDASTPSSQRPAIIDGSRSLWCGKYDAAWTLDVGYPNHSYQILYLDTGAHGGSYTLTFEGNVSTELSFDYLYVIGGGTDPGDASNKDPLQNRRDYFDSIISSGHGGPDDNGHVLVAFTGSIQADQSVAAGAGLIAGAGSGQPNTVSYSISGIPDRAVYFVLVSDAEVSAQDGLWPEGDGGVLDLLSVSDNGSIYNDQVAGVAADPHGGTVLTGTYGSFGCVSARTPSGVGELWQLAPGTENSTSDGCAPQKVLASDLFFEGGDPLTNLSVSQQFTTFLTCTLPIAAGSSTVIAQWNRHMDLPKYSGLYQAAEYRYYKEGTWSSWRSMSLSGGLRGEGLGAWAVERAELAEAAQADSVQLRFGIQCVPTAAADQANCSGSITNALLFDDLRLEVVSGVPLPVLGIAPASLAQTTFIDGTQGGVNCGSAPCWPGLRGSALGTAASHNLAVHDNFHSPYGDSITIACASALRQNGMGINWRRGFSKSVNAGEIGSPGSEYAVTNGAYNPAYDVPRMIFRLFDPATKTWSPFDSTELVADAVVVAAAETTVVHSGYQVNWPPYDKSIANALLPGGFTVNGTATYNGLRFLPRGTRLQYYFKAVDINGAVTYRFSPDAPALEVEDLPLLPGGSVRAPDIIEFRVLPGVYPPGPVGSLLAGRTNTPVLNLDRAHGTWSFGYDPVTQALRGLGVRADRYRFLSSVTTANGIGGREQTGTRVDRAGNFFPNLNDWALIDSLATWYRIVIESGHAGTTTAFEEQDALAVEEWWRKATGVSQGDRCILVTGDHAMYKLLNAPLVPDMNQVSLAQNVFGVQSVLDNWATGNAYPTIDDRFAGGAAAGLAAPGTFTYPIDGGCPLLKRFDALTKVGDATAVVSATYPGASTAAIARSREIDSVGDHDRNKALAYGYSIQFIRNPAYGSTNAGYTRAGVENRMRVLYKFLTSCRAARTASPGDTASCWPCPVPGTTVPSMQSEWASGSASFQTATYGPLYPIQAAALVTGVSELPATSPAPRFVNALGQNRPNPFNPETSIPYSLATPGRVVIRVYDIAGRLVRKLADGPETAGWHTARWDGRTDDGNTTASGVYFYRIEYPEGGVSSKKMILLR